LLPDTWKELQLVYLVKGVHSTTAIEGNTLSEEEVMAIFKKELTLPPSREYLGAETHNIINAMNEAWKQPLLGPITIDEICRMNRQVLANLQVPSYVVPGELRSTSASVGRYSCPSAADVPQFMLSFVQWYNQFPTLLPSLDVQSLAIIKAIVAHLYFVLIHPFGDGNGRTARLIEWRTLDHADIASVATHLLSNHYNLTRSSYYEALDHASRGKDIKHFFIYAISGLVEQLASQLDNIYMQYRTLVFFDTAVPLRISEKYRHAY
jgi:Fic family protein